MTNHLVDIASYQSGLALADVRRAGFDAINLKISHSLGQTSVHPNVAAYAAEAKTFGLGICTFHYLTSAATGAAQATYAFKRLLELDLVDGTAHQVDVESTGSPPTWRIIADYVATMQALLGRPIAVYTGDWWWQPRGWDGSVLTPYLWAAPNTGYPGSYPGDTSPLWQAGYGGWPTLAVMQYAVEPLRFPDGTTGMIKVSKSAIRDPKVWEALTGGEPMAHLVPSLVSLRTEYNLLAPGRDKGADGWIGDPAHAARTSDHNPDALGRVLAVDIDSTGPWPVPFPTTVGLIIDRCRSGQEDRLEYVIWDRHVYSQSQGWTKRVYDGVDPHTGHAHFSARHDHHGQDDTRGWNLLSLEDDMTFTDAEMKAFPWQYTGGGIPAGMTTLGIMNELVLSVRAQKLRDEAILAAVRDDADKAEILARVDAKAAELAAQVSQVDEEVVAKLGDPNTPNEVVAAALEDLLGDRKDAVLALMQ